MYSSPSRLAEAGKKVFFYVGDSRDSTGEGVLNYYIP